MSENFSSDSFGSLLRKNKRLSRELAKIYSVFNAINSAILVVDKFGNINFANASATRIFSICTSCSNIFKFAPSLEEGVISVAETSLDARREFDIDYPEKRTLAARIIPFNADDLKYYAIIIDDITQKKISDREQIENEKISSIVNLASGVAHELGNPLNSISIHLQLAKRRLSKLGEVPDHIKTEMLESIGVCMSEVSRLDTIIENFLKALRPLRPNAVECDCLKPLAETLNVLSGELSDIGIAVAVNADAVPKVFADENLLKQLYFNVLRNAMEAMDGGGSITITASFDDDYVRLCFADTGCGIDESAMANLFEPYFTTKPDGHGLGMMIIQAIVRAHSGKIDVDSKKGEGTKISISLPRFERAVRRLT